MFGENSREYMHQNPDQTRHDSFPLMKAIDVF